MPLEALRARLLGSEWLQVATAFFAALLFAWLITWPSRAEQPNDGWYALAQVQLAGLALLALAYGIHLREREQQLGALLATLTLALLSAPLALMAYALSYPSVPLGYALGLGLLDSSAFFGLGLAAGAALRALRLSLLSPILAPALLVGGVALDSALGVNLLNPFAAILALSWPHLLVMAAAAAMTALWLGWPRRGAQGGAA